MQSLERKEYLSQIELFVKENYNSNDFPKISLPRNDWQKLSQKGIMLSMIPKEYGGRDSHQELCDIIEKISLHNLPLGMYTMIITALFIRNVTKYGTDKLKEEILPIFSKNGIIGGFALTEPHCGSNLAKMTTEFEENEKEYIIKGEKHWQAFSLTADWWLIAAKNSKNAKEFGYFIIKREEGWNTVEEYKALGLKAIDYGRSIIDVKIPKYRRLNVNKNKLLGAIDFLCASRLSMAAMASGFITNILSQTKTYTKSRKIGNGTLYDVGYVKYKLKLISSNKTIAKSLFYFIKNKVDFRNNLIPHFFESQAIKVLATDKMLESALNYQQLCGGEGYRYNSPSNNAGYALLDARVYTIFDGTNDLLSQQIAEYCIKEKGENKIITFLKNFKYTEKGIQLLNVNSLHSLENLNKQEEMVMLGQIISRIFGLNCIVEAKENNIIEYGDFINAKLFLIADVNKILAEIEVIGNNCLSCI